MVNVEKPWEGLFARKAIKLPKKFENQAWRICCTSVDDAKHAVKYCTDIDELTAAAEYEVKTSRRKTLLKMIARRIRKLVKRRCGNMASLDMVKYLDYYGIEFEKQPVWAATYYLLNECLFGPCKQAAIIQSDAGLLTYWCYGCPDHHSWRDVRAAISMNQPITQFCKDDTK
jgi:hypothetical protein